VIFQVPGTFWGARHFVDSLLLRSLGLHRLLSFQRSFMVRFERQHLLESPFRSLDVSKTQMRQADDVSQVDAPARLHISLGEDELGY